MLEGLEAWQIILGFIAGLCCLAVVGIGLAALTLGRDVDEGRHRVSGGYQPDDPGVEGVPPGPRMEPPAPPPPPPAREMRY